MIFRRLNSRMNVLDKYNKAEKLAEEEKIKDSSESALISTSFEQKQKAELKDFKIMKVIDKGSFGKVFLVANKYSG
jgi:hypothetical protein